MDSRDKESKGDVKDPQPVFIFQNVHPNLNIVHTYLNQIFMSAKSALENDHTFPFLLLFYSTMDVMAWLDCDKVEVGREEFVSWCDKYIVSKLSTNCTGEDLYGARCGVVHNASPESGRTRGGQAKIIYYGVGKDIGAFLNRPDIISLSLDEMHIALMVAPIEFLVFMAEKDPLPQTFIEKTEKMFIPLAE